MELGTIKSTIITGLGWLSIVMGLISLAIINITLLSGFNLQFENTFSSWIIISSVIGFVSLINKRSRSLGLWGLGISIFMGIFLLTISVIGWIIAPFP